MKYVFGFLALWIGSFMIITEFISDLFYPTLLPDLFLSSCRARCNRYYVVMFHRRTHVMV